MASTYRCLTSYYKVCHIYIHDHFDYLLELGKRIDFNHEKKDDYVKSSFFHLLNAVH